MHELSVCQAIVTQAEQIARSREARVTAVTLRIGPLSGVETTLLEHAFPLAVAGTLLSGARLIVEALPVRVRCRCCGEESNAAANRLLCAHCGDWRTELVSGDELLLASVELQPVAPVLAARPPDTAAELSLLGNL